MSDEMKVSKADLKEALADLNKEYKAKLDKATDEVARLKATLEMQEAKSKLQKPDERPKDAPRVQVIGNFNPIDQHGKLAKPYMDANPDKHYRFIRSKPDEVSLRRSQGFEPVMDKKGAEVRHYDTILASMPKTQFEETIAKPIKDLREFRRRSIGQRFHAEGEALGVQTFGDVTYDKEGKNE